MHKTPLRKGPRLLLQSRREESRTFRLSLTTVPARWIVRWTGGGEDMSAADAKGLFDLFVPAFDGYSGAMLFGGTRIISIEDPTILKPSISEIPPLIRQRCPGVRIHGVIPRTADSGIDALGRLLISFDGKTGNASIVHPDQDEVLVVQESVDEAVSWDGEWRACAKIIGDLRAFAGFQSLLISYNGGHHTGEEIRYTADCGWPVLLVKGSGRATDEFAEDASFLAAHPRVRVVEKTTGAIRRILKELGVIP